jgi:hypothetical protein
MLALGLVLAIGIATALAFLLSSWIPIQLYWFVTYFNQRHLLSPEDLFQVDSTRHLSATVSSRASGLALFAIASACTP